MEREFDIVVVGAGHAGLEACLVGARLGLKTAMITMNIDHIVYISCNPSIGGLGKSHIVREIDALGGEMAKVTDRSAIQYKVLNKSKGMAVWSLRAQIDKYLYSANSKKVIQREKNLFLFQDVVIDLLVRDGKVEGVMTERGGVFKAKAVILCTGTFLGGKIYIGNYSKTGGRLGELSSTDFCDALMKYNFKLLTFKTGTPARVHRESVNFSKMDVEAGDLDSNLRFSYLSGLNKNKRMPCFITYTNEKTHEIILNNKKKSPLFSGKIKGIGPRYCPSIEDKVVRFSDKNRHQLYLEPEGLDTDEYYVNGLSSSMPEEIQYEFIQTIVGMEEVRMIKPAYAVEYHYLDPLHLQHTLETKRLLGLYFAGQINGTSGYEEAAGQGLVAGINAALKIKGERAFILDRKESYIGVMIDDLVLKGTKEPYRMFTSRAENRLSMRLDNADERLTERGKKIGLVSDEQMVFYQEKKKEKKKWYGKLHSLKLSKEELKINFQVENIENTFFFSLFKRSDFNFMKLINFFFEKYQISKEVLISLGADIKYEGYVKKQKREIKNLDKKWKHPIPQTFDFESLKGLKKEAKEKLNAIKPKTLEQASRIPGITFSDLQLVLLYLSRLRK